MPQSANGLSEKDIADLHQVRKLLPAGDPRRIKLDTLLGPEATPQASAPPADVPWYKQAANSVNNAVNNASDVLIGTHTNEGVIKGFTEGIPQMVKHPIDSAELLGSALLHGHTDTANDAFNQMKQPGVGNKVVGAGRYVQSGIPGAGPLLDKAGQQIINKDYSGGFGTTMGVAGMFAAPKIAEVAPSMVKAGVKAGISTAEMLKKAPSEAMKLPAKAVDTAVKTGASTAEMLEKGATTVKNAAKAPANLIDQVKAGVHETFDASVVSPVDSAIKALKPKNTIRDVRQKLEIAIPEIQKVAREKGINIEAVSDEMMHTVADDLAGEAARRKWNIISKKIADNGTTVASTEPVTASLADVYNRISEIGKKETKGSVAKLEAKLKHYVDSPTINVAQIEVRIEELNSRLKAQQGKLKVDEGMLRRDPRYSADFAEIDALRKMQDDLMTAAGEPVRQLKKEWGALREVQGMIQRNQNVAERASPESLFQGLGRMAGVGNVAGGAAQMARGVVTASGEAVSAGAGNMARGTAQIASAKASANANNRSFMLRNALRERQPSPEPSTKWQNQSAGEAMKSKAKN